MWVAGTSAKSTCEYATCQRKVKKKTCSTQLSRTRLLGTGTAPYPLLTLPPLTHHIPISRPPIIQALYAFSPYLILVRVGQNTSPLISWFTTDSLVSGFRSLHCRLPSCRVILYRWFLLPICLLLHFDVLAGPPKCYELLPGIFSLRRVFLMVAQP